MATTRLPIHHADGELGELHLDQVPAPEAVPGLARSIRRTWEVEPDATLDLGGVCDRLGIEVSEVALEVPGGGAQGFLIPRRGGFRIEFDPEPRGGWGSVSAPLRDSLRRHRSRFLIAHELAHTLFYRGGPTGPRRQVFDSPRQERFCDEMARALLVPSAVAARLPFEPESAVELQRRFDVSMELALRGLTAAHGRAGVAWLLLLRDQKEALVQWASADRGLTARALKAIRELAAQALRDGRAEGPLLGHERPARALHLPGRGQVLATWERSA